MGLGFGVGFGVWNAGLIWGFGGLGFEVECSGRRFLGLRLSGEGLEREGVAPTSQPLWMQPTLAGVLTNFDIC